MTRSFRTSGASHRGVRCLRRAENQSRGRTGPPVFFCAMEPVVIPFFPDIEPIMRAIEQTGLNPDEIIAAAGRHFESGECSDWVFVRGATEKTPTASRCTEAPA